MLDVVFWKWRQPNYRSRYTANHVNIAENMVRRHYRNPVRISCITDDDAGISKSVRCIPLWSDFRHLRNPSFRSGPSCYHRLKMYSREAAEIIGPRFVSLDLDFVAVADLSPLWDREDEYVVWGDVLLAQKPGVPAYNGSMCLMTAGARSQVWERFSPQTSPSEAHASGCRGSDQGWVTYVLGAGEKMWTQKDGVYSWRMHLRRDSRLPLNARIVFFHGVPWDMRGVPSALEKYEWIMKNYR